MNKFLGSLLNNLWALIGSSVTLGLFILWYIDKPDWEPLIGIWGALIIFLGSVYSYIFYWPTNIPKLELSHEASSGTPLSVPIPYRITGQLAGQPFDTSITWNYTFFIRNSSSYPAFKVKFHLRDKFAGIKFAEMNQVRPIQLFRFNEMYLQTVERLHKDEPIKPVEKVGFEAKFSKSIFGTQDDAILIAGSFFPAELTNMEILVEYSNEDNDTFFTLFTKTPKDTWENKRLKYKPLNYTKIGRFLKFEK